MIRQGFEGTFVNQALPSLYGELLKYTLTLHSLKFQVKKIKIFDLLELSPHDRTKLPNNPSIHFQAEIHQCPGTLELPKQYEV